MRFPLLLGVVLLFVTLLVDGYIFCALWSYSRKKIWRWIHAILSVVGFAVICQLCIVPHRSGSDTSLVYLMVLIYIYMTLYLPKILFVIFDVLSRIPMLWHGRRWGWMSWTGFSLAIVLFLLMVWGTFNAANLQIKEVTVEIPGLPRSFSGMKIVQLSDLHTGSQAGDTTYVAKIVDKVNSLTPDLILFTGDIVNRHSPELKPFMSVLSRLHARYGVYSVLGNHDYGDYYNWDSESDKLADIADLKKMEGDMGWHMLNNDHAYVTCGTDTLVLVGVENIGDPPFKVYGNLKEAYSTLTDEKVKILLSHNPAHWDQEIAESDYNIALTLAGHTHAMQMELFGISPSALRYKHWGGMYTDSKNHKLYVNIGVGVVGFPARIGATPEITVFTLK